MKRRLSPFDVLLELVRKLCGAQPGVGAEMLRGAVLGAVAAALMGVWWGGAAMIAAGAAGLFIGGVVGLLLWFPDDLALDDGIIPAPQDVAGFAVPRCKGPGRAAERTRCGVRRGRHRRLPAPSFRSGAGACRRGTRTARSQPVHPSRLRTR
ncbi:MAG: hypothetical protein LPJ94_06045 [Thauera sp.]|nr:hypothetical protein [Thauera sp.]